MYLYVQVSILSLSTILIFYPGIVPTVVFFLFIFLPLSEILIFDFEIVPTVWYLFSSFYYLVMFFFIYYMCGHITLFNITCLMLRCSVLIFITLSHEYDQQYVD